MRPIRAPDRTVGRRLGQRLAERDDVVERSVPGRASVAVREHDPPVLVLQQIENEPKGWMVEAIGSVGVTHVIDHHRDVDLLQETFQLDPFLAHGVDLGVPAEMPNAVDRSLEFRWGRYDVEELPEIETRTAYARIVKPLQIPVADGIVDDRDAAIVRLSRKRIQQDRMIGAVDGRLHHDAAVDPERAMHSAGGFEGGILRRRVGAGFAQRVAPGIAENMDLTVAAVCRRSGCRRARVVAEFRKLVCHRIASGGTHRAGAGVSAFMVPPYDRANCFYAWGRFGRRKVTCTRACKSIQFEPAAIVSGGDRCVYRFAGDLIDLNPRRPRDLGPFVELRFDESGRLLGAQGELLETERGQPRLVVPRRE